MTTTKTITVMAALTFAALSAPPAVHAADDAPPASPARSDPLATARGHVAAKRWPDAITELKRVNATASADWNNLMGYSLRRQATPDLDAAQRHYEEALRIDARHRGALEYLGELFLMRGDLARAEQQLAALDRACSRPCEEQADLKKAIDRFKANGNRFVP